MAFPPAFDRAFDETFPPDTQLANLLGQDIRNLKTDIRERFALLSGTFANRPTNMDAAFGGGGYGTIYIATDTNQIFQWTGGAWTDISTSLGPAGNFIGLSDGNQYAIVNPAVPTVANTVSVPDAQVHAYRFTGAAKKISGVSNCVVSLIFNTTTLLTGTLVNIGDILIFEGSFAITIFGGVTATGVVAATVTVNNVVQANAVQLTGITHSFPSTFAMSFGTAGAFTGTGMLLTVERIS